MTLDSDYGYIYTFIQYLKMVIDIIIDAFGKLSAIGGKKEEATTEAPAADDTPAEP